MNFQLLHPRDQLVAIMNRIYHNGMTTLSGGNLSIKDDNGSIWITPSGIDKGKLTAKDMMCIKPGRRPASITPQPTRQFDRVEQVLEQEPGLGVALDREAPLEEQRVGIGTPRGEEQEIRRASGEADVDRRIPRQGLEARGANAKRDARPRVADRDAERFPVEPGDPVAADKAWRSESQRQRAGGRRWPGGRRREPGVAEDAG